jgi:hypothetical protein
MKIQASMKNRQIRMVQKEERKKEREEKRAAIAAEKTAASLANPKPEPVMPNTPNFPKKIEFDPQPQKVPENNKDDLPDINDPEVQAATMKIQASMKNRQIRMVQKEERKKEREEKRAAIAAEKAKTDPTQ